MKHLVWTVVAVCRVTDFPPGQQEAASFGSVLVDSCWQAARGLIRFQRTAVSEPGCNGIMKNFCPS
jgi:hypothetical protein